MRVRPWLRIAPLLLLPAGAWAATGGQGRVTVAEHSTTAILLDRSGAQALDSQRDGLRVPPAAQATHVF